MLQEKKINRNILRVPVHYRDLFRYWVEFTKPLHGLTDSEANVFASILMHRYELSKVITDPVILENILMSDETRKKIREDCGTSVTHFHVIIGKLRKKGLMTGNKIVSKLIPKINDESQPLGLTFMFDITDYETRSV